jgi:hypothetical protein
MLAYLPNEEMDHWYTKECLHVRSSMDSLLGKQVHPDPEKHKRIMRAYANLDKDFGFEMGYNWLTTSLLYYNNDDEEKAFWCLCAVMIEFNWKGFYTLQDSVDGVPPRIRRLRSEIHDFVIEHIPRAMAAILEEDDEMGVSVVENNLVDQLFTSLFTRAVPIEYSSRILDVFFWECTGEWTLMRILGNIL